MNKQTADIKLPLANFPFGKICDFLITRQLAEKKKQNFSLLREEINRQEAHFLVFVAEANGS